MCMCMPALHTPMKNTPKSRAAWSLERVLRLRLLRRDCMGGLCTYGTVSVHRQARGHASCSAVSKWPTVIFSITCTKTDTLLAFAHAQVWA